MSKMDAEAIGRTNYLLAAGQNERVRKTCVRASAKITKFGCQPYSTQSQS